MRNMLSVATVLLASFLTINAFAQPPEEREEGDDGPRRPARERILRAFDKDSDGRLNDEERGAMREQMGERFEAMRARMSDLFPEGGEDADRERPRRRGREDGARPDDDRDRDREGRRGPRGERRGGPDGERRIEERRGRDADRGREFRLRLERMRGPGGPMGPRPERNLQALFAWFDNDGDSMLSRREFAELSQFVERRRPGPPRDALDGPRFGRRGPDGPPRGDREDFGRRRERFEGSPRGERPQARDRDGRRRGEDSRRPRGDAPRPPRLGNPPNPPGPPEDGSADPV